MGYIAPMRCFIALSMCLALGCSRSPKHPEVSVSVPAWQSLVCEVAGEDAHVFAADLPGAPPARLAFRNGLGLDEASASLAANGKQVVLGDRVPALPEGSTGAAYVWTDPQRARLAVQVIGEELARADAARAKEYRTRAKQLDARLSELDAELARTLQPGARVPVEARAFAERFGLAVDPSRTLGRAAWGRATCGEGYVSLIRSLAEAAQK